MKKVIKTALCFLLISSFLCIGAAASDWPQFLGEEDAQGLSDGQSAVKGEDLVLRWEKRTGDTDENGAMNMTWYDIPGSPIVVDGCVYYYSSQYLRKLDLESGEELAKAMVYGARVNQFFVNIAYGEGKIFVPCQTNNMDDGTGVKGCFFRVYDAETLEQLYITESLGSAQMQSPVMYHDGYFVTGTYGRNTVYACFSAEDEDPDSGSEVKSAEWIIPSGVNYGFSFNGAAFVGDYCYYGTASSLFVVNYKSGEYRIFDVGDGYAIRSTIVYSEDYGRLYVSCCHPDGGAAVKSYELGENGMPVPDTEMEWASHTPGGGTQATPVIYNGRLYLGGGGGTMGSAEPFHVINAATLEEIYSVPVLTKGSAAVSTAYADEDGQVYIYLVPFAPNSNGESELWIVSDRPGQSEAKYEVVSKIGRSEYSSQTVLIAEDGSLIWYNDAGALYCYENTLGSFSDTQGHWAEEHIRFLARRGVINGMGGGIFAPAGTVTRGQFVQMLAKLSGAELTGLNTDAFEDVSTEWYAPAVAWAVQNDIVDAGGKYRPKEPISRQDMASMLYRYAVNVAQKELTAEFEPVEFKDSADIADYAVEAVSVMQQSGIINGIADGNGFRFAPEDEATRAQAATMMTRFYQKLNQN